MNDDAFLKVFVPILVVIMFFFGFFFHYAISLREKEVVKAIAKPMIRISEVAYFEGQKDAIEGDIKIKKINDEYKWIKSPWDKDDKECCWAQSLDDINI